MTRYNRAHKNGAASVDKFIVYWLRVNNFNTCPQLIGLMSNTLRANFVSPQHLLSDLMTRLSVIGGRVFSTINADAPIDLADLCFELLSHRGEATGAAIGQAIFDQFDALDVSGKHIFFQDLSNRFGVDTEAMESAFSIWNKSKKTKDARVCHFNSEPKSQELIRRLNRVPNGTVRLIEMRKHLLQALKVDPALKGLDDDFRHLLTSWFNSGFLDLRRIDWNTSAEILEKIIAYEAVHEIKGWGDLRRRVAAPDRRLYAFFHPALQNEPLIFVEVALSDSIPEAIGPIISAAGTTTEPKEATTAVFYSISNCQKGLRGISFGNFLIKQVVRELRRELDTLTTFVTLSPIPGLRAWAQKTAKGTDPMQFSEEELSLIAELDGSECPSNLLETHAALVQLTAKYLVYGTSERGGPADPVARFHLGNGACLKQINPAADHSERGIATSWGVMVNYLYDLKNIQHNHEVFANGGDVICSASVKRAANEK